MRSQAYKKYMTKRVKYKAHSETTSSTRATAWRSSSRASPLSKDKRWRVAKLDRARQERLGSSHVAKIQMTSILDVADKLRVPRR